MVCSEDLCMEGERVYRGLKATRKTELSRKLKRQTISNSGVYLPAPYSYIWVP